MSKFCTNCGKELSDGAAFCDNCGTPIGGQSGGQAYQPEQPYQAVQRPYQPQQQYQQPYQPGQGAAIHSGNQQQNNGQGYAQSSIPVQPYVQNSTPAQNKSQKTKKKLPLVIGIIAAVLVLCVIISLISGSRNRGSYQDRWSDMMDKGYITIEEQ